MRRSAHGRRPPRLRPRPQPAAYGGGQGRGLHDEPRGARRARLRVLEEPLGRARRRGAGHGSGRQQGPHAAQAARDRGRLRSPRRGGHRDQAPDEVRRARRASSRGAADGLRLDRRGLAGAGDELQHHGAATGPADGAGAPQGDADREGAPLAHAASGGREGLDHRAGRRRAARPPGPGQAPPPGRSRDPRLDRQHGRGAADLPRPRRHRGDQRQAGATCSNCWAYSVCAMAKKSRTKARDAAPVEGSAGTRSARASPARAVRASATRRATVPPAAPLRRSSAARSRDCRASAT